jgi:hypothetical protein
VPAPQPRLPHESEGVKECPHPSRACRMNQKE